MADYFNLKDACDADAAKKAALPPIVYLFGDDTHLLADATRRVKAAVLTQAKDFNFAEFDAKEQPIERVIQTAETLPMMAARRLVCVRRAEEIKTDAADKLLRYAGNPSPSTVLLLVGATLDSRTKLSKTLSAQKAVFECAQLKKPQLFTYVSKLVKTWPVEVSAEVYDMLFEAYASDLSQWLLALERMALFLGVAPGAPGEGERPGQPRPLIDAQVAEALVFRTRTESVFALTDAVLSGMPERAMPLAEELVQAKEAPLAMVGLVARQVRQLLILREALDRGEPPRDFLRVAGIPPFVADKYIERAKKTTQAALIRAHARLTDADIALKSSKLDSGLVWFNSLWSVMTA